MKHLHLGDALASLVSVIAGGWRLSLTTAAGVRTIIDVSELAVVLDHPGSLRAFGAGRDGETHRVEVTAGETGIVDAADRLVKLTGVDETRGVFAATPMLDEEQDETPKPKRKAATKGKRRAKARAR